MIRAASQLARWIVSLSLLTAAVALVVAALHRSEVSEREIFRGVWYRAKRLTPDDQGRGLMHVARVNLRTAGVELYVTPLDGQAVAQGRQYLLRYVDRVATQARLAVAMNATLYQHPRYPWILPGEPARSGETTVSAGVTSHVHAHSYLIWLDADREIHVELTKPPPPEALRRAVWGVSGQGITFAARAPTHGRTVDPRPRTALGVDPQGGLLWLATFEHATEHRAASEVLALGADFVTLLDSGSSTSMSLGQAARGVRPGTLVTGYLPVATQIGVRAEPIN